MRQTDAAELETMVRTLREPYGRAAAMYLLDGLPVAAIAQKLGRPAPTVRTSCSAQKRSCANRSWKGGRNNGTGNVSAKRK